MSPAQPPQAQGNLPMSAPTDPNNSQLNPDIMQMLMQMLTSMPDIPAGGIPNTAPTGAIPSMAKTPTATEMQMKQMQSQLMGGQAGNIQNGAAGGMGGMFGGLGGRPQGV